MTGRTFFKLIVSLVVFNSLTRTEIRHTDNSSRELVVDSRPVRGASVVFSIPSKPIYPLRPAFPVTENVVNIDSADFILGFALLGFAWVLRKSFSKQPRPKAVQLPHGAEFLLYLFLDPQCCDALVGDLEERYRLIHKKFGKGKADFWYWKQAVWSLGPLAWAAAKRWLVKPVAAGIALAQAKHWISGTSWLVTLVEWWKRIGS